MASEKEIPQDFELNKIVSTEKEINPVKYDRNTEREGVKYYMDNYAPKDDDSYLSRFSTYYPAPKPYTKADEARVRNAGAVSESLKSLAEIYGQSKGAHLQERQPTESEKASQEILYSRNKYDKDLRDYQRAYLQAAGADSEELKRMREKALGYGQSIAGIEYNKKMSEYARKQNREDDFEDYKRKQDYATTQYGKRQKMRIFAPKTSSGGYAGGKVTITSNKGDIATMGAKDWVAKAQSIYTALKGNKLPPLMKIVKDPSDPAGLRTIEVEDRNANNIAAYVERNINSDYMTDQLWDEIYALSSGQSYSTAAPKTVSTTLPKQAPKGIGTAR